MIARRRAPSRLAAPIATIAIAAIVAIVATAPRRARAQEPTQGPSAAPPVSEVRSAPRLTKEPKLVRFVEAPFPAGEARSSQVKLAITIGADGAVRDVAVLQSGGADFDAAAVAAARAFVFEPAEVDGRPAAVKIAYTYAFTYAPPPPPAPETRAASLDGAVRDRATRQPLAGAKVTIVDLGRAATTDAEGRFSFADLPPGDHDVAVSIAEYEPSAAREALAAGKRVTIEVLLPRAAKAERAEDITVRGARRTREAVDVVVSSTEARKVAGTQGDTLKVVQNLPGVARPSFGSGQLVVWGSAPEDTRVVVDGVEIPAIFHGSALRSTINADLVKSVELVPGGYGAEYGRGLGGLVKVETQPLPASGVHGYASADTLDASGMVTAAIGDRVRVGVAARYGYLDALMKAVAAPDVGDAFIVPRYQDWQGKASFALRDRESLDAVVLGSHDAVHRAVPSTDPARARAQDADLGFQRLYLHYTRTLGDGTRIDVTPFVGRDATTTDDRFGGNPASLDVKAWRWGLRASERAPIARRLTLAGGFDVDGTAASITRRGSLSIPAREGDVTVFGQPPGEDYAADDWQANVVDVAPWATLDVDLGPLTIAPGLRGDAFLLEASRQTPKVGQTPAIGSSRLQGALEPRIAARWQALPRVALLASAGTYTQAPRPEDMSAVFGTPDLAPSSATHYAAGEQLRIGGGLSAEVIGFVKQMSDLVVRSRLPTPKLARALVQDGEGRVYGLQMLLRQEMRAGFFGWIAYTISRSERRYVGDVDWHPFDYDQPHVFTAVLSKQVGAWTFGARFRYARGLPRTPVTGAFYDARDDQYQPLFGAQNSIRLPDFHQLDLRVDRAFTIGAARLLVYVEGQNLTFHQNAEEYVYSDDYTRRGVLLGLPTLAVAGARVEL